MSSNADRGPERGGPDVLDALIIGSGFSGLYLLYVLRQRGFRDRLSRIEATREAGDSWTQHMADLAASTLLPLAESWYMGANIPGKPRQLLHHVGVQEYFAFCRQSAENGYSGFELG